MSDNKKENLLVMEPCGGVWHNNKGQDLYEKPREGKTLNCRLRCAFYNDDGHPIYLEITSGLTNQKNGKLAAAITEASQEKNPCWLSINYCFYESGREGVDNENECPVKHLGKRVDMMGGPEVPYNEKAILNLVNEVCNASFTGIAENPEYHVHRDDGGYNYGNPEVLEAKLKAGVEIPPLPVVYTKENEERREWMKNFDVVEPVLKRLAQDYAEGKPGWGPEGKNFKAMPEELREAVAYLGDLPGARTREARLEGWLRNKETVKDLKGAVDEWRSQAQAQEQGNGR